MLLLLLLYLLHDLITTATLFYLAYHARCPTAEAYRLHREPQPLLVVMIIISIITLVTCKELAKSLS